MRIQWSFQLFNLALLFLCGIYADSQQWPIQDNGLQSKVRWDHYSLIIDGERPFIFSGEMHPFRLPVPELWPDILEKMKAAGMRAVSIYLHWGFHSQYPNVTDFETGAHNLERFFQIARDIGIYVIVRPGPYINAETSAGGLALWVTNGQYGTIRSNGDPWTSAWLPYWDAITKLTAKYQLTGRKNGTALMLQIENEFPQQWKDVATKEPNSAPIDYMRKLESRAIENGITIPTMHNMPSTSGKSWSKDYDTVGAGGNVNLYGLDSYPSCWSCIPSDCSTSNPSFTLLNYWDHFQHVSPNQPPQSPEFQGGALNPWYGPTEGCKAKTDENFVNFYYRDNIAQRLTILNLYMFFGGTNWGWLTAPFVTSSYDYSAAISEDRSIGSKYYEIKNFGLFTRVADELSFCDRIGNDTSYTSNAAIFTTVLENPNTKARFYVIRHTDPASNTNETFSLDISTSIGKLTIPKYAGLIKINGHESKILVSDFHAGPTVTLLYSTAEILSYSIIDGYTIISLWVPTGLGGEFFLKEAKFGIVNVCDSCSDIGLYQQKDGVIVKFRQGPGRSVLTFDNKVQVIIFDRRLSYLTFIPGLDKDPAVLANKTAIVIGPRLVRSAELNPNSESIYIKGDSEGNTSIEIFTSHRVKQIIWNNKPLLTVPTAWGSLQATTPTISKFTVPTFGPWKLQDSLPEIDPNYSDDGPAWVIANKTSTRTGKSGTKPYLFADEYSFYTGIRLWRGNFTGNASSVYLQVQGGRAFGFSAWLNGQLLGSFFGVARDSVANLTLPFTNATLKTNGINTLTVIHDDSGHEEGSSSINPRGILNATLLGSSFSSWKVAGTAGGSTQTQLDKVRTHYNEGGLTAERLGWHLPGFDDRSWNISSPSIGFNSSGIRFYRTNLPLHVPDGHDVSLGFKLAAASGSSTQFRVYLYVNGYQYGRFYAHIIGPTTFPVPVGVLNYNGDNVIGLAVWAQSEAGAAVEITPVVFYTLESSLQVKFDGEYLRPSWDPARNIYK